MSKAFDRVRARLRRVHGADPARGDVLDLAVLRAGALEVAAVVERTIEDEAEPSDDDVALLAVWCRCVQVRDVAWSLVDADDPWSHFRLWSSVVRRTVAPFEPAVLCLAGFSAWLCGDGARADHAVERALAADRDYTMADLLRQMLDRALPPQAWVPVPPELVWPGDGATT